MYDQKTLNSQFVSSAFFPNSQVSQTRIKVVPSFQQSYLNDSKLRDKSKPKQQIQTNLEQRVKDKLQFDLNKAKQQSKKEKEELQLQVIKQLRFAIKAEQFGLELERAVYNKLTVLLNCEPNTRPPYIDSVANRFLNQTDKYVSNLHLLEQYKQQYQN